MNQDDNSESDDKQNIANRKNSETKENMQSGFGERLVLNFTKYIA